MIISRRKYLLLICVSFNETLMAWLLEMALMVHLAAVLAICSWVVLFQCCSPHGTHMFCGLLSRPLLLTYWRV